MSVHNILRTLAGRTAIVIPFLIGILALRVMLPQGIFNVKTRLIGIIILLLLFMIWAHLQLMIENMDTLAGEDFLRASFRMGMEKDGGGVIGGALAVVLFYLFNVIGSQIVLATLALISLLLIVNVSLGTLFGALRRLAGWIVLLLKRIGRFLKDTYAILMTGTEEEQGGTEKKIAEAEKPSFKPYPEETLELIQEEPVPENESEREADPSYYQKERRLALVEPAENGEPAVYRQKSILSLKKQYYPPSLELLARPNRIGEHQQTKGIKIGPGCLRIRCTVSG